MNMKKQFRFTLLVVLAIMAVFLVGFTRPVWAGEGEPVMTLSEEFTEPGNFWTLLGLVLGGQGGIGVFVSAFVNALKSVGLVKNDKGLIWVQALNLVLFVVFGVLMIIGIEFDPTAIEEWLVILTTLLGLVVQLFASEATHAKLKGLPVVGKSYTHDKLKAMSK
jgi:hypothetical protein